MSAIHRPTEFKVIVIGNYEVGKTSLAKRFVDETFDEVPQPDQFDNMSKTISVDGKSITLRLADTAGGEKFRTLTSSFYRHTDAAVVVYDPTNEESFGDLDQLREETRHYAPNAVLILCANKIDLSEQRVIPKERGEEYAKKSQMPYFEASAKTGDGVSAMFNALARMLTRLTPNSMGSGGLRVAAKKGSKDSKGAQEGKKSCLLI